MALQHSATFIPFPMVPLGLAPGGDEDVRQSRWELGVAARLMSLEGSRPTQFRGSQSLSKGATPRWEGAVLWNLASRRWVVGARDERAPLTVTWALAWTRSPTSG